MNVGNSTTISACVVHKGRGNGDAISNASPKAEPYIRISGKRMVSQVMSTPAENGAARSNRRHSIWARVHDKFCYRGFNSKKRQAVLGGKTQLCLSHETIEVNWLLMSPRPTWYGNDGERAADAQVIPFKLAPASASVFDDPIADQAYLLAARAQAEAETPEQSDQLYCDHYCGGSSMPFAMTATDHNIRAQ